MLDATNLSSMLKDQSLLCTKAYISGEWVDADDSSTFEVKKIKQSLQILKNKKQIIKEKDEKGLLSEKNIKS